MSDVLVRATFVLRCSVTVLPPKCVHIDPPLPICSQNTAGRHNSQASHQHCKMKSFPAGPKRRTNQAIRSSQPAKLVAGFYTMQTIQTILFLVSISAQDGTIALITIIALKGAI